MDFISKCLVLVMVFSCVSCDNDYFDDVVNMLLNYDDRVVASDEEVVGEQPFLSDGIWKCGDCKNIEESNLIYSEFNEVDTNFSADVPIAVQISYSLPEMRCISISAEEVKTFKTISGACNGDFVNLSVYPNTLYQFTVKVYS